MITVQIVQFIHIQKLLFYNRKMYFQILVCLYRSDSVADPGAGAEGGMAPPSPVKISHKKDCHQRRPHRFHVSCPPLTRPLAPLLRLIAHPTTLRSERS